MKKNPKSPVHHSKPSSIWRTSCPKNSTQNAAGKASSGAPTMVILSFFRDDSAEKGTIDIRVGDTETHRFGHTLKDIMNAALRRTFVLKLKRRNNKERELNVKLYGRKRRKGEATFNLSREDCGKLTIQQLIDLYPGVDSDAKNNSIHMTVYERIIEDISDEDMVCI